MQTVRQFVEQSYQLISASSPTVPLHGSDLSFGITILNQLLEAYAATGLMLTIAQEATCSVAIGQKSVSVGPASYTPTPDITLGRLANLENAWLLLDGVTYPLIDESRAEFLSSYKYDPLKGLPRFVIVYPGTEIVNIRLYPAPSQVFQFFMRGKFQLTSLTSDSDLSGLPQYYVRYLLLALARDLAVYKGRSAAWTPNLEALYAESRDIMESASEVNLTVTGDRASLLNGAWRLRSGV